VSQIAPSGHEALETDARRSMTPARRARITAKHDGHCAYPGCEETAGLEIDHIIALALGGKDRDDNLEALCRDHHRAKTTRDRKLIAKAARIRRTERGERPVKAKIKSAGFRRDPLSRRGL
jgi:5-methylcytosine-specific restriction protein A